MIPIILKNIILSHKSQEAASAASWECSRNFSFLLLQNVVRADCFSGLFGGFEISRRSHSEFTRGSSPPQAAKCVRTIFRILHHVGNCKSFSAPRRNRTLVNGLKVHCSTVELWGQTIRHQILDFGRQIT